MGANLTSLPGVVHRHTHMNLLTMPPGRLRLPDPRDMMVAYRKRYPSLNPCSIALV